MFNQVIDAKFVSIDGKPFVPCEFTAQFKAEFSKHYEQYRSNSNIQRRISKALMAYPYSFSYEELMCGGIRESSEIRFGQLVKLSTPYRELTLLFKQ